MPYWSILQIHICFSYIFNLVSEPQKVFGFCFMPRLLCVYISYISCKLAKEQNKSSTIFSFKLDLTAESLAMSMLKWCVCVCVSTQCDQNQLQRNVSSFKQQPRYSGSKHTQPQCRGQLQQEPGKGCDQGVP